MRYVALMRGFGPGDPNMRGEKLSRFFTGLGFSNVHPIISSGNVIFDTDIKNGRQLEEKIEKALPGLLGFSRAVIVRSQPQLEALVAKDPYKGVQHSREQYQLVTFFKGKPQLLVSRPDFYDVDEVNALCSTIDTTAAKTLTSWLSSINSSAKTKSLRGPGKQSGGSWISSKKPKADL